MEKNKTFKLTFDEKYNKLYLGGYEVIAISDPIKDEEGNYMYEVKINEDELDK